MNKLILSLLSVFALSSVAEAGPKSAREDWFTSSAIVTVEAGRTWDASSVPMPQCPAGEKFLVTHLSVLPEFATGQLGSFPEVHWAAFVAVRQYGNAPQGHNPILRFGVTGIGVEAKAIDLPAGLPTPGVAYPNGQINLTDANVQVDLETSMPDDLEFIFHITGSCGTYHSQQWVSTPPTRGTQETTRSP